MNLDIQKRAVGVDRVNSWWRQVPFPLIVNNQLIGTYIVDFQVLYADGRTEYIEVKGVWTDVAKLKVKLFRALYPELKLTIHE